MTAAQRRAGLVVALVATLIAAGWVSTQDHPAGDGETISKRPQAPNRDARTVGKGSSESIATLPLEFLQRPSHAPVTGNLFPSRNWLPPPPKTSAKEAAKVSSPPPPAAPPLPFSTFGQMEEGGQRTVFLHSKDRAYAARVGDVIEKTYRVDAIRDGVVVLNYLPLNQQQTVPMGAN